MNYNKELYCSECRYFTSLKLKHNISPEYDPNRKIIIQNILLNKGLPLEICDNILNYYNQFSYKKCSLCKDNLCLIHQEKALNNAKYHKKEGLLCGSCCWYLI